MRSLVVVLLFACIFFLVQAEASQDVSVSSHALGSCAFKDLANKVEQIVQGLIYSVANVVNSLGASVFEGISCVKHPKDFISCVGDVITYEVQTIEESVGDYLALVQTLVEDIVHDITACV